MTLVTVQSILAKIALTLQGLLLLISNAGSSTVKQNQLTPFVNKSFGEIVVSLNTLSSQLASSSTKESPVTLSFDSLNSKTRSAVVNIYCRLNDNSGRITSGSGVIIDPRGVILTNAHVAEYFLLKNYSKPDYVDCSIRTGSPAEPMYRAKPLFIPEAWLKTNAQVINETNPTGTGENDFALLLITSKINGDPSPDKFDYVPMDESFSHPEKDSEVIISSYPAEYTKGILAQNSLNEVSGISKISSGYYFNDADKDSLDLIDVSGSIASQGGSSGGAVVEVSSGKLVGIVVTTTKGTGTTSSRELYALTTSHVARKFLAEANQTLDSFLAGDLISEVTRFETVSQPNLLQIISSAINH